MWQWNMKLRKRKSIVEKIAKKTHTSSRTVIKDTLPYIRPIFKNNKEEASRLAEYFELDKEEAAYLAA